MMGRRSCSYLTPAFNSTILLVWQHQATNTMVAATTTTKKTDLPYNFGPASDRDEVLWTCQRPGGECTTGSRIDAAMAQPQIDLLLLQHKIDQVLILLDDHELSDDYTSPDLLPSLYHAAGITVVHHEPMNQPGAAARILGHIRTAEEQNQRIVAHCTHGMGRSGRVAAGWLVARYLLSPANATAEVMETAHAKGIQRMGDVESLTTWLGEEITNSSIVSTIYHMCEKQAWNAACKSDELYYPLTYEQDGFIHATMEPATLLTTANQFCSGSPGDWVCIALSVSSLRAAGIPVRFEVPDSSTLPAAVASQYPHIYGGIPMRSTGAVVQMIYPMERDETGRFTSVTGLWDKR